MVEELKVSSGFAWTVEESPVLLTAAASRLRYPEGHRAKEEAGLDLPTPAESWDSEGRKKQTGNKVSRKMWRSAHSAWSNPAEPAWSGLTPSRFRSSSPGTWTHLRLTEHFQLLPEAGSESRRSRQQTWWGNPGSAGSDLCPVPASAACPSLGPGLYRVLVLKGSGLPRLCSNRKLTQNWLFLSFLKLD